MGVSIFCCAAHFHPFFLFFFFSSFLLPLEKSFMIYWCVGYRYLCATGL